MPVKSGILYLIMTAKQKILYKFNEYSDDLRSLGVKRIGLFGSFAKGQQHSRSDLDVLVEFKKNQKTFDHFMDLKFFLQKRFGKKVDLVVKDALKPSIRQQILKEVLYAGL